MERFIYLRAVDVQHAAALLREPGIRSRVLAGGTDLVLMARGDRNMCDRVVDISLIPELHRISREADTVTIGAAATFSEVIESPIVNETAPVLVQACRQVGAVQIRNMGTLGGNVANAAACADSLPALVCLDAVARILTPSEVRTLAGVGTGDPAEPHADSRRRLARLTELPRPGGGQPQRLSEAGPPQRAWRSPA